MTNEVMQRLQGGNPIQGPSNRPPVVDPKLLDPGMLERILGIAAPVLGGMDAYNRRPVQARRINMPPYKGPQL